MIGLKRDRPIIDDGEDEVVEVDSVRSSLRQDMRKRLRPSKSGRWDDDSEDSVDEDYEQLQATQYGEQERRKRKAKNRPAENGVIESVTCTNFMCHAFLHVDIGPLVNFVIGHNGSGKSAVLTALTICLGGKASSTNRGGSLKAFIKEGEETCTLCVKLKNGGDSGFQPDTYGDCIYIERAFNKSGSSNFKLKSSTGRLISSLKKDLDEISDYYALQLDNPICVLTQDMARQFLSNSSPQDKYKLFFRGVQLEQLNQDYELLNEYIDQIEDTFEDKKVNVRSHEERMVKARALFDLIGRHDSVRQKVHKLGVQMAWAQVEEQERALQKLDDDLQACNAKIQDAERLTEKSGAAFDRADTISHQVEAVVEELNHELEPIETETEQVKTARADFQNEVSDTHAEHRRIKDLMRTTEQRIAKAIRDIADETERLEQANGTSHTRRLAELEHRKAAVEAATDRLKQHQDARQGLKQEEFRALSAFEASKRIKEQKNQEFQQVRSRATELTRDRGQQRRGYPVNMSQLLGAIRQENDFAEKPIGPVGDHIQLLKPLWSSVLEKSFGGVLNSFIVTSKQDRDRLHALMNRVRCVCQINIISDTRNLDLSGHEPDPEYQTVLRVLQIDNPLVLKQLVISQTIEQIILIEDMREATERMINQRIRNVRACYTLDKNDQSMGHSINWNMSGGIATKYIDTFQGLPRMKTDIEDQIRLQQNVVQRVERESHALDDACRDLQKALEECKKAVGRHDKPAQEMKSSISQAQALVDELQEEIDNSAIEEGRLEQLKRGLQNAEKDKSGYEIAFEEAVLTRDKQKETAADFTKRLGEISKRKDEAEAKIKKAQTKVVKSLAERQAALKDKNAAFESLDGARKDKERLEDARKQQECLIENYCEQAGQVGPRVAVDPEETTNTLDKKLEKLVKDIERYEARLGGNKQKIAEDYTRATQAYNQAFHAFQEEEKLAGLLKVTLIERQFRWKQFRKRISARARIMFTHLLSERAFHGQLKIDHHNKALDLNVQPDETQKKNSGRHTKTLSGGEKSFSTICLLLSLWDAIGAPIRCLDEFDVFMDSANRQVSMNMLISTARNAVERQFIFITPQAMGNIDREWDIKIIRMQDPERGQTRLPFGRQ